MGETFSHFVEDNGSRIGTLFQNDILHFRLLLLDTVSVSQMLEFPEYQNITPISFFVFPREKLH